MQWPYDTSAQLCHMQCSLCPQITVDGRLQERNLGVLQGLTLLEAAQQQPQAYAALRKLGPDVTLEVRVSVMSISACCTADKEAQLAADAVMALLSSCCRVVKVSSSLSNAWSRLSIALWQCTQVNPPCILMMRWQPQCSLHTGFEGTAP